MNLFSKTNEQSLLDFLPPNNNRRDIRRLKYREKELEPGYLPKISKVTPSIYLSGVDGLNERIIEEKGINYILCCTPHDSILEKHRRILENCDQMRAVIYLPYNDLLESDLWQRNVNTMILNLKLLQDRNDYVLKYEGWPMIDIGADFIDKVISEAHGKILVHCVAGVSRSVSVILYYLMKKYNLSYDDALKIVRHNRNIVGPNTSFERQLREYDKQRGRLNKEHIHKVIFDVCKEEDRLESLKNRKQDDGDYERNDRRNRYRENDNNRDKYTNRNHDKFRNYDTEMNYDKDKYKERNNKYY